MWLENPSTSLCVFVVRQNRELPAHVLGPCRADDLYHGLLDLTAHRSSMFVRSFRLMLRAEIHTPLGASQDFADICVTPCCKLEWITRSLLCLPPESEHVMVDLTTSVTLRFTHS